MLYGTLRANYDENSCDDVEECEDFDFLLRNDSLYIKVVEVWKKSFSYRENLLKKSTIDEYVKEILFLANPNGYLLFCLDFEKGYSEAIVNCKKKLDNIYTEIKNEINPRKKFSIHNLRAKDIRSCSEK